VKEWVVEKKGNLGGVFPWEDRGLHAQTPTQEQAKIEVKKSVKIKFHSMYKRKQVRPCHGLDFSQFVST